MVIDCAQCEFRVVACGECLVTALVKNDEKRTIRNVINKDNQDTVVTAGTGRRALGAQQLRALGVLAAAGLVPPLRYRPAQVRAPQRAIVALSTRARVVIRETGASLSEALETAKCFHYGLIPVTSPNFHHGQSPSIPQAGRDVEKECVCTCVRRYRACHPG
jgi:hypothetical protein